MPETGQTGTGVCELPRITNVNQRAWSMSRAVDGHRTYKVTYRVEGHRVVHGPAAILTLTPGLPEPGSSWEEGQIIDQWAFFTQEVEIVQHGRTTDNKFWDITFTATTKPTLDCAQEGRTDPLLFPDRVEIETVNYSKEIVFDRFGSMVLNSAWEQIRGPQVEFDAHRLRVTIEQNVASFDIDLVNSLMHVVNDSPMWGFPARQVKLSAASGKPQYTSNCDKYWVRRLVFDIATDFDRTVMDEGTKVLRGQWDKNPQSPTYGQYKIANYSIFLPIPLSPNHPRNFIRYQDWNGEHTRVILDGHGRPWDSAGDTPGTSDDNPGETPIQYYEEDNLFLLGVPVVIDG